MSGKGKILIRRKSDATSIEEPKEEIEEVIEAPPKAVKVARKRPPVPKLDTDSILASLENMDDDFLENLIDETSSNMVRKGDTVSGVISEVRSEYYLVSVDAKSEAFINNSDILGGPYDVGQTLNATVLSIGTNGIQLTMTLGHAADSEELYQAMDSKLPVMGRVTTRNSGGYVVDVSGRRAFCPHSQIDIYPPTDPDIYLQQEFRFLIQELSDKDMMVSRRALLEVEAEELAKLRIDELEIDKKLEGTVRSVKDFGIFVDLDGIQGLIPRSQFRYMQRMPLSGDTLEVEIASIDTNRMKVSLRPIFDDPWQNVSKQINVGDVISVTVVRVTDFGLFAEIRPGVEGLIHIRNLSNKRVNDIHKFSAVGQSHQVRVLEIDLGRKRVGLGIRQVEDAEDISYQAPTQTEKPNKKERGVSHLGQLFQNLSKDK